MNDEFILMKSAAPAQIATVPLEDEVQRLVEDRREVSGFLNAPVNGHQAGADEPRMNRRLITAYPKQVRKRNALEPGQFIERTPQEERDFLPSPDQ